MFTLTFSTSKDVATFAAMTSVSALKAVLPTLDHNSQQCVDAALKIASQPLQRVILVSRNDGVSIIEQYVDINLSNINPTDPTASLMALRDATVHGNHCGEGIATTKDQCKENWDHVQELAEIYHAMQ